MTTDPDAVWHRVTVPPGTWTRLAERPGWVRQLSGVTGVLTYTRSGRIQLHGAGPWEVRTSWYPDPTAVEPEPAPEVEPPVPPQPSQPLPATWTPPPVPTDDRAWIQPPARRPVERARAEWTIPAGDQREAFRRLYGVDPAQPGGPVVEVREPRYGEIEARLRERGHRLEWDEVDRQLRPGNAADQRLWHAGVGVYLDHGGRRTGRLTGARRRELAGLDRQARDRTLRAQVQGGGAPGTTWDPTWTAEQRREWAALLDEERRGEDDAAWEGAARRDVRADDQLGGDDRAARRAALLIQALVGGDPAVPRVDQVTWAQTYGRPWRLVPPTGARRADQTRHDGSGLRVGDVIVVRRNAGRRAWNPFGDEDPDARYWATIIQRDDVLMDDLQGDDGRPREALTFVDVGRTPRWVAIKRHLLAAVVGSDRPGRERDRVEYAAYARGQWHLRFGDDA
jgi:hypothetical protein